jgi:hypothetical protein
MSKKVKLKNETANGTKSPNDAKPLLGVVVSNLSERVIDRPFYTEWDYPSEWGGGTDSIREKGKLNYEGLNEHEKMILYIYAWNLSDFCPTKKSVMKEFGWSAYKVAKMYRELKQYGLECVALFSENTGLLCGRGYRYYYA